jgi:hypothetical protein
VIRFYAGDFVSEITQHVRRRAVHVLRRAEEVAHRDQVAARDRHAVDHHDPVAAELRVLSRLVAAEHPLARRPAVCPGEPACHRRVAHAALERKDPADSGADRVRRRGCGDSRDGRLDRLGYRFMVRTGHDQNSDQATGACQPVGSWS